MQQKLIHDCYVTIVPCTALTTTCMNSFHLLKTLWRRYYFHPHFADEEAEIEWLAKGYKACVGTGVTPGSLAMKSTLLTIAPTAAVRQVWECHSSAQTLQWPPNASGSKLGMGYVLGMGYKAFHDFIHSTKLSLRSTMCRHWERGKGESTQKSLPSQILQSLVAERDNK